MRQTTYQEAFEALRQAGFVGVEIDRLYQLCRTYQTSELDQAPLDLCRLQFIRWLVTAGRLTDQLPETKEQVVAHLDEETERHQETLPPRGIFPLFRRKE